MITYNIGVRQSKKLQAVSLQLLVNLVSELFASLDGHAVRLKISPDASCKACLEEDIIEPSYLRSPTFKHPDVLAGIVMKVLSKVKKKRVMKIFAYL